MRTVKGDLLKLAKKGQFDVIVHGCNCICTMGAGIAKQIKSQYPSAFEADSKTIKGSKEKLGTFSSSTVTVGDHQLTIVNAYTQYHWRGNGNKADYGAIRSVFKQIKQEFGGLKIGYPMIGAGLAGGDWSVISSIICEGLQNENHTLVQYAP
ncbi:macro domain-containing protein [Flocculibacter collagenilyticus]|uniref:macro domain-containing protein n=1 Tax=Flocculibacter collagenilyticus TaxID=2744479 RepID=UPI0018F2A9F8|nr:macro domain-containing protein [Flocculibacter collagenilyticus]